MPAVMTPLKIALVLASVIATFAYDRQPVSDDDSVTLLQGAIQEKSSKHAADVQIEPVEPASEYNLPESAACTTREVPAKFIEPIHPASVIVEHIKSVRLTPEAESGDPPGAYVLRATLELLIIVIIFDGMRRWQLQKQETAKTEVTACKRVHDAEAAAEAAWIEMVNAATAADVASFEKALGQGPSVTRTDTWSCTPLHFAAAGGSMAIATELLKRGAEVDAVDASEETPLHFAARAGHSPICELLLGAGAKIDAVNVQEMTPFVVAGHANQEAACRLLADHGAGVAGLYDEQLPPLVVSQLVRKVFAA